MHSAEEPLTQNEPAGHVVQDEAPGEEENVPGGQVAHEASDVKLSVGPYVVEGHGRQADFKLLPGLGLYVPASQGVQEEAELAP